MLSSNSSIAISGEGMLQAWFATEFEARYPGVTVYERTERFRRAVEREVTLAFSGAMERADVPSVGRAEWNLHNPVPVDVTVEFRNVRGIETAKLVGRTRTKVLRFDVRETPGKTLEDLRGYVLRIVLEVSQML